MIRVLITGAGSYVGESVRKYILAKSKNLMQLIQWMITGRK